MKAYNLPANPLATSPDAATDSVSIFSYHSNLSSANSRITLQQNMFSFLLEGEKTVSYAGSTVRIKPGEFLLLSAGNCLMSQKIALENGIYRSILLSFDTSVLSDFFSRHTEISHTKTTESHEEPVLIFEKDAFLNHFVESLSFMLAGGQTISANMRLVKLDELLLYLAEHFPGQLQKLRNMTQQANEETLIRQAVMTNIDNLVTVEELAFLCNTSLSTFKRRFAKIYGTSPNKWLFEKRMQKAAQMLVHGNRKASEIYYEVGYENLSSFIQSFKQVYGITPKQYQRLN